MLVDPVTSWPLSSTSPGRIGVAIHSDLFVSDQRQRMADLNRFFTTHDEAAQREILLQYDVR